MGDLRIVSIALAAACLNVTVASADTNVPQPPQTPQPPEAPQPQQTPLPQQTPQPYPQQQPQPYPGPQPYPQQYPQPYPAQYPQQYPQPYQQPYPQQPAPAVEVPTNTRSHVHDGEVIANFAVVGTMASLDVISRQEIDNGNAVTFLLLGGVAGGGGIGYLLTNKYEVDAGTAHATTLGLTLGFANGALLIEPTGWTRSESVLNLLFLGSAVGATGGFMYGHYAHLTSGQATFVGNMTLLGTATAALGAISGSHDGEFGNWENGTLAVGIDGGTAAGMLIAPRLDWSARRAKVVMASTVIGAFAGGMLAGLVMNPKDGESRTDDGDIVAASMTAGLWGGFGLGVMMTRDSAPAPTQPTVSTGATTSFAPWIGRSGTLGVMSGGTF
jgi:hypothetical protein